MNSHKDKIIGKWLNDDICYIFYEDGNLTIYWIKEDLTETGQWSIVNDEITFAYGVNLHQIWKGRINHITDKELSITDESHQKGVIDILQKKKLTIINPIIEEVGKIKSDESLLNSSKQNESINKKEEVKSTFLYISLVIGIPFLILSLIRHTKYYSNSMFDDFFNFIILTLTLISTIVTFYFISVLFSFLQKKPIFNIEHFYEESFIIFFKSKLWENEIVIKSIFVSFILSFIVFLLKIPFILIYLLLINLILGLLSLFIKRGRIFLTYVLAGILPIILFLNVSTYQKDGIYYHWYITGNAPLINYGFGNEGDPIENKEFFWSIDEWENFERPFPSSENQLEYFTTNFFDTFIFYSFNGLFLIVVLVCLYLLGRIFSKNLIGENHS